MGRIRLPYDRHRSLLQSHSEYAAILDAIEKGDEEAIIKAIQQNVIALA